MPCALGEQGPWAGILQCSLGDAFDCVPGPQYSMHCCVLGFLSCSVFLHMSFELKLLLLLLWLVASSSLFLHSYAWLSDCLIAHLYRSPLDSR